MTQLYPKSTGTTLENEGGGGAKFADTPCITISNGLLGVTQKRVSTSLSALEGKNRNAMNKPIQISGSHTEAARQDRTFWSTQTVQARLQHVLELRRMNHGTDRVSLRLRRVLEITQR